MSQENVEIVRRHIEAYAAGDAERALSFVDPAIEVDLSRGDPVEQDRYQGHEGLARYVRTFRGAFTDYRFEIRRLRGAGDEVVALIHEAGRGRTSGAEPSISAHSATRSGTDGSSASHGTRTTPTPSKSPGCRSR